MLRWAALLVVVIGVLAAAGDRASAQGDWFEVGRVWTERLLPCWNLVLLPEEPDDLSRCAVSDDASSGPLSIGEAVSRGWLYVPRYNPRLDLPWLLNVQPFRQVRLRSYRWVWVARCGLQIGSWVSLASEPPPTAPGPLPRSVLPRVLLDAGRPLQS
jgi:hypothetical protein